LPGAFHAAGSSSFTEFLTQVAPELLPGRRPLPVGLAADTAGQLAGKVPHATTIVAIACADGVLMGGDRRATMGNLIAQRDIEKVFVTDTHTAIGIAGTAGLAVELVRLFRLELEHYEKIEGTMLSLDGKANRLATMIRNNLGAALQGLAVIPLFAGFDLDARSAAAAGRIFSFDVAGGVYEEHGYDSIGSGSLFAKSSMKKRYRPGLTSYEAARVAIEALYDAADYDTATGGPDLIRKLFPVLLVATAEGTRRYTDAETEALAESIIAERRENPGS
jgi:proteasome beta subunit